MVVRMVQEVTVEVIHLRSQFDARQKSDNEDDEVNNGGANRIQQEKNIN